MALADVRISLLGRVTVEVGGREVEPPPRTHGLLAILALSPDGVERGELAALVAPGSGAQGARRRLSRLMWLLRDAVPDLPIVATSRRVRLDMEHCEVDAAGLKDLESDHAGPSEESLFARLKGPLCPHTDLPWVQHRRVRLEELSVRLGLAVAEARTARGDHRGAWEAADWVLDVQPRTTRALELRLRADLALGRNEEGLELVGRWCRRGGIEESAAPAAVLELASALRTERPLPDEEPTADAPPDAWLTYARLSGARGDERARRRALERLRAAVTAGALPRRVLRLAEIDAALARHELPLAERLIDMSTDEPDTVALRVRRCHLALLRRQLEVAAEEASEALVGAYVDGREDVRIEALLAFATVQSERAHGRDALAAAAQAREAARQIDRLDAELTAEVITGREEVRQSQYASAAARMDRARDRAAVAGFERLEGHAMRELSRARCRMGEFETAATLQRDERALWQRLGYRVLEASVSNEYTYTLICMGRHAEALEASAHAARLAGNGVAPLAAAWARAFTGLALVCRDGATPPAFEAAREAGVAADEVGNAELIAVVSLLRGFLCYMCSDTSTALAHLARAREQYVSRGEFGHMPVVHALEALVRLHLGEVDEALAATKQGLTEVAQLAGNDFSLPLHYVHARALEAAGRGEEARAWIERGSQRMRAIAAKAGLPEEALVARDPLTRALAAEAAGAVGSIGADVPGPLPPAMEGVDPRTS